MSEEDHPISERNQSRHPVKNNILKRKPKRKSNPIEEQKFHPLFLTLL
jgi:hypothetical protein